MVVPSIQESRSLRAATLTTWIASLLAWLYITVRIVFNGIDPPEPLLPGVPGLSFLKAGVISFGVFCVSMFLYLWLWGNFDRRLSLPQRPDDRRQ